MLTTSADGRSAHIPIVRSATAALTGSARLNALLGRLDPDHLVTVLDRCESVPLTGGMVLYEARQPLTHVWLQGRRDAGDRRADAVPEAEGAGAAGHRRGLRLGRSLGKNRTLDRTLC